jgi:hypothetical protein
MFNLQIEPVNSNDRILIIEPYDDYFISEFVDWTNKVDISKEIQIIPTSNVSAKNYKYNYTDDSDFLNTQFKQNQNNTYGYFDKIITNDFTSSTIETKITFSPTPLFDGENQGKIIIPAIFKDGLFNRVEKSRMRILYWTGIKPALGAYEINNIDTGVDFGTSSYGYAGHMDNPKNATLDLNFGIQPEYFYGGSYFTKVTENTLYNKYYNKLIEEITNPESRMVKMYMKLNSFDISNLSFRRGYWIKGVGYKLQKINDYNPLTGEVSLCEFIKSRPVKPISRPFVLECNNIPNGFSVGSVGSGTMDLITSGDTIAYINELGEVEIVGTSINMSGFPNGVNCFFGSTSEGIPYPSSSFGGEILSFQYTGTLTFLSFEDATELYEFFVDGSMQFTTLDLSQADLTNFFGWYDGAAVSTLQTIDISNSSNLTYIEILCNTNSFNNFIVPTTFNALDFCIIQDSGLGDTNIDTIINAIDPSIPNGYLQIDGTGTGQPTSASLTRRNALIVNGWTLIFN